MIMTWRGAYQPLGGGWGACLDCIRSVIPGCLFSFAAQVHHQQAYDGESLMVPGVGACSVTVLLRTALFPHFRARNRKTTPNPPDLFHTLAESFRQSLAKGSWVLPSLADCEALHRDEPDAKRTKTAKE